MNQYEFKVTNYDGLHARPCAKLVELLEGFQPVTFIYQDQIIEVLSVLELLMLKIPSGESLIINTHNPLSKDDEAKIEKIFS